MIAKSKGKPQLTMALTLDQYFAIGLSQEDSWAEGPMKMPSDLAEPWTWNSLQPGRHKPILDFLLYFRSPGRAGNNSALDEIQNKPRKFGSFVKDGFKEGQKTCRNLVQPKCRRRSHG